MAKQYNFGGVPGLVVERKSQATGAIVRLYHAEQGLWDTANGPWATACMTHHTIINHRTLADAHFHLPLVDWCEECQKQHKA